MLDYRTGLSEMPSYDGTEREWRIKVDANESPLRLPPLVEERVMSRLSMISFSRYPTSEADDLAGQIAADFSVGEDEVLLGNGSSEIIEKIFFALGGPGHRIVFPTPSFSMYGIYARAAEAAAVPFATGEGYEVSPEKFVSLVKKSSASLAVICNPNNPTGNLIPPDAVEYIAKNIGCALLVDEAYIEFSDAPSAAKLIERYPHVIVARTFSKAYGLAAARLGYALAKRGVIEMLGKAFMPYHLNVLSAVTAGVVYQMRDEFTPRIHMIRAERARMAGRLAGLGGLLVYPSHTNFLFIKYPRARELSDALAEKGIGVRTFGAPDLSDAIRLSMGTREENDIVFNEIAAFVTRC